MILLLRGWLRKYKIAFYLTLLLVGFCLLNTGCISLSSSPSQSSSQPQPSQKGLQLIEEGKYEEAASHFFEKFDDIYYYCKGRASYEKGADSKKTRQYTEKINKDYNGVLKKEILEFKNLIYDESVKHGFNLIEEGNYNEAYTWFLNLEIANKGKYYDSSDLYNYVSAMKYYNEKDYKTAKSHIEKLGDYSGYGADQIHAFKEKVLKGLPEKIAAQEEAEEAEERKRIAAQEAAVREEVERIAAQEAAKEAAEKARRKQEGVVIGMTQQEVLDSCWGNPLKINRTTTVYGVSEQWVYDNYNYLYFEDGILTAIQN